jgi:hypothetical protein
MIAAALKHSWVVEIGGIPVSLSTDSTSFRDLLGLRYSRFLSSGRAEYELHFQLTEPATVSEDDVCVRREGRQWRIERGDFCARWDPESGRGSVKQTPNPYSVDSVLRILHSLILARKGGFLLHAASAIWEGRAYLFPGNSGAGKTTITRLAPSQITLLTDEISYVRPGAGGYRAYGTPFAGELARSGENCSAPIAALFFLERGPANRIDELSPAGAVGRLMRNILFFADDRELVETLFATACDFVAAVPSRRLTFYPDSRVWDTIGSFENEPAHV